MCQEVFSFGEDREGKHQIMKAESELLYSVFLRSAFQRSKFNLKIRGFVAFLYLKKHFNSFRIYSRSSFYIQVALLVCHQSLFCHINNAVWNVDFWKLRCAFMKHLISLDPFIGLSRTEQRALLLLCRSPAHGGLGRLSEVTGRGLARVRAPSPVVTHLCFQVVGRTASEDLFTSLAFCSARPDLTVQS